MTQIKEFKGCDQSFFDMENNVYCRSYKTAEQQVNEFLAVEPVQYVDLKPNGNKLILIYRVIL
jgi:hypothetical protein